MTFLKQPEAVFKEFEPRLKFKPGLKYGWFHLRSYSIFQYLSRRSFETGFFVDLRRGLNSLNSDTKVRTFVLGISGSPSLDRPTD